jgi:restriction endonuclease S subunit
MSEQPVRSSARSKPLRRLATIRSSNVNKVMEEGQEIVRLCNYVDVYYHDRITADIEFSEGSAKIEEIKKFSLKVGDVLITKDSETPDDIAVPALVEQSAEGVICGYHLAILRPNAGVHGPYLFWSLKAKPIREAFSIRAQGVTRYGLTLGGIGSVSIPIHDIDTQVAIAAFLDRETVRIDQLIEKKERQIGLLIDKKTATIHQQVRQGVDRNTRFKSTGNLWFPIVPDHWEPIRIRYLYRPVKRQGMTGLDVLSVYRDHGVILKSSRDDNINKTPEDLSSYQLVEQGDLVINKMKAWQGSLGISSFRGITSPDYLVYTPLRPLVGRFMHHYLRAPPMPAVYLTISNGIRTDQWRLEHEQFANTVVWLPPMADQARIAAAIDAEAVRLDSNVEGLIRSVSLLRERRAALITAVVTGQINVREQATVVKMKPDRARFRAIIGAEIVHRHQGNPKFGRVKLQKELYLAEAHIGINELGGNYLRYAAGPYDEALIQETERGLETAGYYRAEPANRDRRAILYAPLANAGRHTEELKALLGSRLEGLQKLIALLIDFDKDAVEAIATLYAVWNDGLMDGNGPDDTAIIRGFLTEWHRDKERFKENELHHWLGWMRRNGLVPRGQGPRTAHTMTRDMFAL